VISGEGGAKTKDFCRDLGAAAYFEKPVDFEALRDSLAHALHRRRLERRKEVRVGLRVPLKLSGLNANDADFSLPSTTENVSKGGFLCACAVVLTIGSTVDVYMLGPAQEHVGKASGAGRMAGNAVSAIWIRVHGNDWALGVAVNFSLLFVFMVIVFAGEFYQAL
jgi:hypothetical protein